MRRAEDLADADLPGAAAGGEGGQPEQPQAGDENGEPHEDAEHLALAFVGLVQLAKIVIQEMPPHRLGRREDCAIPGL